MKRLISIFITLLILVSCFSVAYATEEESTYTVGEIVELGSYPQAEVTDEATIQALNAIDGDEHYFDGYYCGEPISQYGNMKYVEDDYMMCYKDVELNGEKYRGIMIKSYRPMRSDMMSHENYSCQDTYYERGEWYYFKYEPLKWRVFDGERGLALCEKIIDSQPYNSIYDYNGYEYTNFSTTVEYANNFASGTLRDWLHEEFLTTAFTEEEQALLPDFTLDTCFEDGSCGSNRGAAVDVQVGLLTYKQANETEATETEAAKVKNEFVFDLDPQKISEAYTGYSRIQGCNGNDWWLVTPCLSSTDTIYTVGTYFNRGEGMMSYLGSNSANSTTSGIRPVISLRNILEENSNEKDGGLFSSDNSDDENNSSSIGLIFGITGGALIAAIIVALRIAKKKKR